MQRDLFGVPQKVMRTMSRSSTTTRAGTCLRSRIPDGYCVPSGRITDILNGWRGISADTAVRLGRYFGNRVQFWLDLQSQYNIALVQRDRGEEIARRFTPPTWLE
jgi:addiction module HigA family antidote